MQDNTVKEKLQLYLNLEKEFQNLKRRLHEIESVLFSPGRSQIDGIKRTKGQNSGMHRADAHLDLQRRCQEKLAEILEALLQIELMIKPLDSIERLLLRYRYVDGLCWDEISKNLDCNVSQAHRIHNRALAALEQNIEKS